MLADCAGGASRRGRVELMAAVDGMDQEALARQLPLSG